MNKSQNPDHAAKETTVVEAQRFVLKDAAGKVRAELGTEPEGGAGLRFFDKDGEVRLELVLLEDGMPALAMFDRNGNNKAILCVRNSFSAWLHLRGQGTEFEVDLDDAEGLSVVAINNDGIGSVTLNMNRDANMVGVTLRDPLCTARADLWTDPEGGTSLQIQDSKGVVRINFDERGLEIADQDGNIVFASDKNRQTAGKKDFGAHAEQDTEGLSDQK